MKEDWGGDVTQAGQLTSGNVSICKTASGSVPDHVRLDC